MIITITGSSHYLTKQHLDKLVGEFVKTNGDLALERLDSEDLDKNKLLDSVGNLPFLSEKKMVVVRGLGANKALAENIEQIISAVDSAIDLVIYEPSVDKRTSYYKFLKSKTDFKEYGEINPNDLAKWLLAEAASKQASLTVNDANYLITRVGTNQLLLASEIAKLATYSQMISKETIDLLTVKSPQTKVFDLMDAAFSGKKELAIKIYEEQRSLKVEPQEIIGMFAWQLRVFAAIKLGVNKQAGDIAKDLGMSPYPVGKAAGLVRKMSQTKLEELVEELLQIDILGKSKPINLDDALKAYILNI